MNNCVFCHFENLEPRTVTTSAGNHIVATLGQIARGYVLLIPSKHLFCWGAATKDQIVAVEKIIREVQFALTEIYQKDVIIFEHGGVGQTVFHAHLHLVPATVDLTDRVRADFPEAEIRELRDLQELRLEYERRGKPYLFWSTPTGRLLVCWDPPAPAMYFRIILADMLGVPERADWKKMDPDLDRRIAEETVENLASYLLP